MILTLVFAASVAYLLIEIFWRRLDRGDSEAVATVLAVPFVNRPELSRADQTFAVDLERIRSTGKKNIRFVNPLKPWDDPVFVVAEPALSAPRTGRNSSATAQSCSRSSSTQAA